MAGRGPAPTPTEILRGRGSRLVKAREKRGEPVLPHDSTVPQPPKRLTETEKEIWFEMAPHVVAMRIMTAGDWREFARYCRASAAWDAADDPHILVKLNSVAKQLAEKFGLTPADRTRMQQVKIEDKKDTKAAKYFNNAAGLKVAK